MNKIKVGINGMGRIGRNLVRAVVTAYGESLEIVAVNDIVPTDAIASSLRRDSTYGRFPQAVEVVGGDAVAVGARTVRVFSERDPARIPWRETGAQVVFECTGLNLTREKAEPHLRAGAGAVVMSAPPKDETPIFVIGTNDNAITRDDQIVSNASCTTNCLSPIVKALDDGFGVESGLMSTTHAVTAGQRVVDSFGNERSRSALNNIIPTSTGAARAIGKVLPHLAGKLNGSALRVPVTTGSVVEAVLVVRGTVGSDDVISVLREQAKRQNLRSPLGTVLYVGEDYQVGADAVGATWSSMVLSSNVMTVPFAGHTLVKVTSFYDNELGYAHRLAELGIAVASAR
ncbi:MAG: type I glyceraldehyde-3-phosphate dehydrogenase, partial [Spirochaetota bacterium]